jgi:hypothetical protein
MSGKKTGLVRVLENAFEINLAKLLAASKKLGATTLTVDGCGMSGLASISYDKFTLIVDGGIFSCLIITVPCLNGRFRPLLKCPRAHEGNFQSLYLFNGELACRKCLKLRYRSNLASGSKERARIQRMKAMHKLGRQADGTLPEYKKFEWRKKYFEKIAHIKDLENDHYVELKGRIKVSRE